MPPGMFDRCSGWNWSSSNSNVCESRCFIWTIVGLGLMVAMLAPLMGGATCGTLGHSPRGSVIGTDNENGEPRLGQHFGTLSIAALLVAVLLDPQGRLDSSVPIHKWVRHYAIAVVIQSACWGIGRPLLLAVCPSAANTWAGALKAVVAAAYVASQGILCRITILRLRDVAFPGAAQWADRLLRLFLFVGVVFATAIVANALKLHGRLFLHLSCGGLLLVYVAFQALALIAFGLAAYSAKAEARRNAIIGFGPQERAASRALRTAMLMAASAVTTFCFGAAFILYDSIPGGYWAYEIIVVLDMSSDAGLALVCAGLLGPNGDLTPTLAIVGGLVRAKRERRILEKLVGAAHCVSGPALTLAALFEGAEPGGLLSLAVKRFRCISWDVMRMLPQAIIDGTPLDGVGGSDALYKLSKPCRITECDAFWSHSWHDDGALKWAALRSWCEEFESVHQRSPTLWVDKFCIDQANISVDLQCLPIFVAGCDRLLITSGSTYTRRLWCCVELFVYTCMLEDDEARVAPAVLTIGANDKERELVHQAWRNFSAQECECHNAADKERIFRVIEQHPGGVAAFDAHMQMIASELFGRPNILHVDAVPPNTRTTEAVEDGSPKLLLSL